MRQTLKRSISFLLTFVMVIGVFATMPFTVFAAGVDYEHNASESTDEYYNLISKTDWDNAPGISESEIVLNNDAGDYRQVIHIMKADVNNSYVSVIPTYSEMNTSKYQTGTMLDQANWIDQNMEGEVIGTMNCCLSWYTGYPADRVGEPLGFMMMNGEIMFDPGNCGYNYGNVGFPTCVVINKDFDENGNARPADIPKVEMPQIRSSADLDGWEDTVIPVSSGYIVKDGVNQSKAAHKNDPAPRSVVGITADGQVVMMENDGRQSPFSAGMNMYECAEVMIAAGCVWAANCDGGGSSTFVSQRPGEELKVNNSPSDGGLRPSTSGICFVSTAPADGQFYKAHISAENEYFTPNSTVKFDAIGTDMAGTVVEIPAEAEWKLVDDSFGTIADGLFTSNGKEGVVTVQLVYNNEIAGETSIKIVLPEITFRNETIVIGYGDTMVLPIEVTTNEGRNPVTYMPGDIVYTLSDDGLGTIVGDQFTACDASAGLTEGTITAVICGLEAKKVTANIRFGKASEIAYDFEDGQLPIDNSNTGNIGGDDAADTGEYIYGWHVSDTRQNRHYSYRWISKTNYTPVGLDIPSRIYVVNNDNGLVRNGEYAMGLDIDWTNVTASCHGQIEIFLPEALDLTDATSVGFWMYIPAELVTASMQVSAGFRTTTGGGSRVDIKLIDYFDETISLENGGWHYFSWEVLDNYKSFDYIQINSHYTATAGVDFNYYQDVTYYIDDITVDYSDATIDRETPYFTSMTIADDYTNGAEVSGQTITTNIVTLMAQAYENTDKTNATGLNRNSVKLYVDGMLSTANIAVSAGGTITVSDMYLNDGVHTIVMEISDNQGNVGNIVRKFTVNTDKSDIRLEVSDPSAALLPTGSIYWLNLVADNLAAIDSVTTTINLDYVNNWEFEGMEVAYGFAAEYYINNHNDAVITFTRTGTEVANTTILAKLPVRIWMAKGWMDDSGIRKDYISDDPKKQDKYYILTPHAMWYSDGTRDYRLAVSAEAGVVTYVDGTIMTFSANETVIQTEMNRYYTNSDRQGKWSFHICTPGTAQNKAPTCTESGYENRVFCVACACGSVENLGSECDTHNGCGSVIEWGTTLPATGHTYKVVGNQMVCECGKVFTADGFAEVDAVLRYFQGSNFVTGPQFINNDYYNFEKNGAAYEGVYNICGTDVNFKAGLFVETEGVLLAGLCGDDVEYIIFADGRMIVDGTGAIKDYKFVGQVPWYQSHRYDIKSLYIGKDITVIGDRAFYNIWYLESVTFEEGSKLQEIKLLGIAMNRNMKSLVLPESLKRIGDASFRELHNVEYIYIPVGVNYIVSNSFYQTNAILKVAKDSYAESYAIKYSKNHETYDVPEFVVDEGTCGENVTWAYSSKGVLTISGSGAMFDYDVKTTPWQEYKNNIKKVVIGADITYIGKFNFMQCNKLTEVVFEGNAVESIGWGAFGYCSALTEITIPASVKTLDAYAFYYNASLETVAFEANSELTTIGMYAFWNDPALKNVYIPDKVTSIGENGFLGCMNTATFYVAAGTYSNDYFKKCTIVTREPIAFDIASGTCGENVTWTLNSVGVLTINGSGAMFDYETRNAPWQDYKDMVKKVVIGADITYIGKFNFMQCRNLAEVVFEGNAVETIGWGAFGYCSALTEITIPASVKTLDAYAFYYNTSLETVIFAEGSKLTEIGMYAFLYDAALENVTRPEGVTLGEGAFHGTDFN